MVHALFQRGEIDPYAQDAEGDSALFWAFLGRSSEATLALLACSNVDVNLRNSKQETALIKACRLRADRPNFPDFVRTILQIPGIDPNLQDENGDTALLWAIKNSAVEAAVALLSSPKVHVHPQNNKKQNRLGLG